MTLLSAHDYLRHKYTLNLLKNTQPVLFENIQSPYAVMVKSNFKGDYNRAGGYSQLDANTYCSICAVKTSQKINTLTPSSKLELKKIDVLENQKYACEMCGTGLHFTPTDLFIETIIDYTVQFSKENLWLLSIMYTYLSKKEKKQSLTHHDISLLLQLQKNILDNTLYLESLCVKT
jgi:hypothetical protein